MFFISISVLYSGTCFCFYNQIKWKLNILYSYETCEHVGTRVLYSHRLQMNVIQRKHIHNSNSSQKLKSKTFCFYRNGSLNTLAMPCLRLNIIMPYKNCINHNSIDFLNQFAYSFNIRKYLALSLIKVFGFWMDIKWVTINFHLWMKLYNYWFDIETTYSTLVR